MALFTSAQKNSRQLDSFSLLAVPFFYSSGAVIMNSGGIAIFALVNFAKWLAGRIPGSLAQNQHRPVTFCWLYISVQAIAAFNIHW